MVQFLDKASIESEDQKMDWNIEERLLQRGSIFMLEIKILFYDKIFNRKFVNHEISGFKKMRSKKEYARTQVAPKKERI